MKDNKGVSIDIGDTVVVIGMGKPRIVNHINYSAGNLETVLEGHVITVGPNDCVITEKAPVVPPAVEPATTDAGGNVIIVGDPVALYRTPDITGVIKEIDYLNGGLQMKMDHNGKLISVRTNGVVKLSALIAQPFPQPFPQPGDRVEACDGEGVYEECITVGPHPHVNGEFVFITEAGMTFVSRTFKPVKTECERTVEAAFKVLESGPHDNSLHCHLTELFDAGFLSEPSF
tara:strand:+ start:498 stop:1190 length:693 start_codon:yes stop_codon:yes gene_type:complete